MLAFSLTHNLNLSLGGTLRFLKLSFHPLKFYRKPLPFLYKRAYNLLQSVMLLYGGDNPRTISIMLFIGKQALDFSKLCLNLRKLSLETLKDNISAARGIVPVPVANYLLNKKRKELLELEARRNIPITIQGDSTLTPSDNRIICENNKA